MIRYLFVGCPHHIEQWPADNALDVELIEDIRAVMAIGHEPRIRGVAFRRPSLTSVVERYVLRHERLKSQFCQCCRAGPAASGTGGRRCYYGAGRTKGGV